MENTQKDIKKNEEECSLHLRISRLKTNIKIKSPIIKFSHQKNKQGNLHLHKL